MLEKPKLKLKILFSSNNRIYIFNILCNDTEWNTFTFSSTSNLQYN